MPFSLESFPDKCHCRGQRHHYFGQSNPLRACFGADSVVRRVLYSEKQTGQLFFLHRFTEPEGERVGQSLRIDVGAEEAVPDGEGRAEVQATATAGGMVNAMVLRGD